MAKITLQMFELPYWVLSVGGSDCLRFETLTEAQICCLELGLEWEVIA